MPQPTSAYPHLRDQSPYLNTAYNKISWGAVFAGVAIALTTQILLNLLGVGIGAAVIDPASSDNPNATTMSVGTAAWFVISGIIASFAGGYVASRLSGRPLRSTGAMHGLTSWAVTTLLLVYLLTTSVGTLVSGAFSGLGSIASGAGQTVATAATTAAPALATAVDPIADIERQVRSASDGNDPAALRDAAVASVKALLSGDPGQADQARTRAAEAIARAQNIPVEQARTQVEQYEASYRAAMDDAKRRATDAAAVTATTVSTGAIIAFVALVAGGFAAWMGGAVGTTHVTRDQEIEAAR